MASDYRSLPAITEHSFDFTVYPSGADDGPVDDIFEGRTERLSRCHLRGIVTSRTSFLRQGDSNDLEGEVRVKFHAVSPALDQVYGHVVELEEFDKYGNRPIVEIEFVQELNLLELRL